MSDELYSSAEGKTFYGELVKSEEVESGLCFVAYAGLSGKFSFFPQGESERTDRYELPASPWKLMERVENCFSEEAEQLLFITDLPYMYTKAVRKKVASLPVALSQDKMDAFHGAKYLLGGLDGIGFLYLNRIYQRHHNIPWRILETERTIVREMTVEDVDSLYEIYKEPSITKYTDNLFQDKEEEKAYTREYIETIYYFLEFGVWIVQDKQNPDVIIGRAGLSMREGFEEPELGYIIAVPYQKKGYATEVCMAIIRYAKEQLAFKKLRIVMSKDNIASRRLCAKLGFTPAGSLEVNGKEMEQYVRAL